VNKRKVDEETNAETWTLSKKRRQINAWRDDFSPEIDVSKESDADFNFPKIHLMSHWLEQMCQCGALQQYSAKRHEQAHKTSPKDGWNASNHNLTYLPQVITCQRRIVCFEIRVLNIQALAQRRENSTATCKVLPAGADLAAPLSSQSYVLLATVPGFPAAVQVWNRTGWSSPGCYPDNRGTHWVRGRVRTGPRFHFTVPTTLPPIKCLSSDRIMT